MIRPEIINLTKSTEYRKSEAEIIQSECEECGYISHYEELSDCPTCKAEDSMIWTTNVDDMECDHCGEVFRDGFANHYTYWGDNQVYEEAQDSQLVCIDCYKQMQKEEMIKNELY